MHTAAVDTMKIKRTGLQPFDTGQADYFAGQVREENRTRRRSLAAAAQSWRAMVRAAWRRRPRDPVSLLDDYILRDIGLTREDAWREANSIDAEEEPIRQEARYQVNR